MSFYGLQKSESSLKFNSPKTWKPDAAKDPPPSERGRDSHPVLPRANSALFASLGFDDGDAPSDSDSSGDSGDELSDAKFSIPEPKNKLHRSKERESPDKQPSGKTVSIDVYLQLKARLEELEREKDHILNAKAEAEMSFKEKQKAQIGILRESFKREMDSKEKRILDLELELEENQQSGASADNSTSTAIISLRSKIEKLEKEKQALEVRVQSTEKTGPSAEEVQKEVKQLLESKTKLENQLERSRSEIMQLQSEKDQSAKELIAMKTDIDKMLSNTKSGDSQLLNAERKKAFDLGEKLKDSDVQNAKLETKIARLEDELARAAESAKIALENAKNSADNSRMLAESAQAGSKFEAESAKFSAENSRILAEKERAERERERILAEKERVEKDSAKILAEKERIERESAKILAEKERIEEESARQAEEFEGVRAEFTRKNSELSQRISELTSDKERLMGSTSQKASESERLVEVERARAADLTQKIDRVSKERDDAQSTISKLSSDLTEASQARRGLEAKQLDLQKEIERLNTENKAQVAALEQDIKDMQTNQAKMKDLYSKKMNESSSSFQGEREELLNTVSDLQTQAASLKSTVDEKDKLLREVARTVERLEQSILQKEIEISELKEEGKQNASQKAKEIAELKEEGKRKEGEIAGLKEEGRKREGEIGGLRDEGKRREREIEEMREERKSMSAGGAAEREHFEKTKREIKERYERDIAEQVRQLEEKKKDMEDALLLHKREIQALTASHQKEREEKEREYKGALEKSEQGRKEDVERVEKARKEEVEKVERARKEEVERLEKTRKEEGERLERARKEEVEKLESMRKNEVEKAEKTRKEEVERVEREKKVALEKAEQTRKEEGERAEKARKEEVEKVEKARKEEVERVEKARKGEVEGLGKKMADFTEQVKKEKEKREGEVKREIEDLKTKYSLELQKATKEKEDERTKALSANATLTDYKARMTKVLKTLAEEIRVLKLSLAKLRSQAEENQKGIPTVVQLLAKTISKATAKLDKTASEAVKKYKKEVVKNRNLYNQIQELKGNIRVYCRVRPMSNDELARNDDIVVSFPEENVMLVNNPDTKQKKNFEFEKIYSPEFNQDSIFKDTEPLITSVVDGYNVCIFAYGQTGSGKTYTMEGTKSNPGVNLRALNELFRVAQERSHDYKFEIAVSVLEIYNETIRDLLVKDAKTNNTKYEIKQGPNGMYVPDLTSVQVHSAADVLGVMSLGAQQRASASTNMNEHSSRSHALLSVIVTTQNLVSGVVTQGKLTLVDLAGSERVSKSGVTKERMVEAQNINKSLSALGDVIAALAQKNAHIPYRNSKLTYLLQDSLGGDSKTLMFVQISPSSDNVGESLCSLNFAARVRSVELGQAKKHVASDGAAEVAKLKAQIKELKEQASVERSASPSVKDDPSPRTPTTPLKKKIAPK